MGKLSDFLYQSIAIGIWIPITYFMILPWFFGDCTDPEASNYNPDAWITRNRECEYPNGVIPGNYDDPDQRCDIYFDYLECIRNACLWERTFSATEGVCYDPP